MSVTKNIVLTISLLLPLLKCSVECVKCFQPTRYSKSLPGCALDTESESLDGTENKIACALACELSGDCVSFNYHGNLRQCRLFDSIPFMIQPTVDCTGYDMYHEGGQLDKQLIEDGENVAKYRRSSQSSTLKLSATMHWSWLALDESLGTDWTEGECSTTGQSDSGNNWFMVDLVDLVLISYVHILSAITTINTAVRYKNLTIGVTNTSWMIKSPIRGTYSVCGVYLGPPPNADWIEIECQPSALLSRFVIVHQVPANSKNGGYLSLCEVQVYGTMKYVHI